MTKKQPLGEVLRAARIKAGMTQQALAYHADTQLGAISEIELGKRDPTWPTLARILKTLDLHLEDLAGAIEYEYQKLEDGRQ